MAHPPILTLDTGRLRTWLVPPPCTHRASCAELITRLPTLIGRIVNLKCQHLAQFALMPTHLELQCWKHWLKWCISENAHCLKFRQHQTNSCVLMIPFVLRAQHVKNHEPIWTQELENGASTERCFFFCEKLKILGVFFENNKNYQIIIK